MPSLLSTSRDYLRLIRTSLGLQDGDGKFTNVAVIELKDAWGRQRDTITRNFEKIRALQDQLHAAKGHCEANKRLVDTCAKEITALRSELEKLKADRKAHVPEEFRAAFRNLRRELGRGPGESMIAAVQNLKSDLFNARANLDNVRNLLRQEKARADQAEFDRDILKVSESNELAKERTRANNAEQSLKNLMAAEIEGVSTLSDAYKREKDRANSLFNRFYGLRLALLNPLLLLEEFASKGHVKAQHAALELKEALNK
jgi:chromosome segregation ATPase